MRKLNTSTALTLLALALSSPTFALAQTGDTKKSLFLATLQHQSQGKSIEGTSGNQGDG